MEINDSANVFDVAPGVSESLNQAGIDHRILGGVATAAMVQANSMSVEQKQIMLGDDAYIDSIRPENGTVRDIDVLVISKDIDETAEASDIARRYANGKLVVSTFGFMPKEDWDGHSLRNTLKDWTSKRLLDSSGRMYYAAHPFITEVETSSYEEWRVNTDEGDISVMSPPAHSLAYKVRSIGGLRHRDREKIAELDKRIDSMFESREEYEDKHLLEWHNFKTMLVGSMAVQTLKEWTPDIYNGQSFSPVELAIYDMKKRLMAWADSKQWALDIAHGKGRLGKIARPILKILNEEHD